MLSHLRPVPAAPDRVVVLGAHGFVGRALERQLAAAGIPTLAVPRSDLDLACEGAGDRLAALLRPDDALVFLAALTPDRGRGIAPFMANLRMGEAVTRALLARPVAHLVYIGSDAVYPLSTAAPAETVPVTERTPAEPTDLYGAMHRSRELMLEGTGTPLAVLRPTMVYGAGDTHNAYGPNRLRRMAQADGRIVLFGEGEELRDYITADDAARLIRLTLCHRSTGLLNLATGGSVSFRRLADLVAAPFGHPIPVTGQPRQVPAVTHRRFDVAALHRAFPDFAFTSLEDGLQAAHAAMMAAGGDQGPASN